MAEIDGGTWWWAVAGSAQLVAGLAAYRRGSGGSSTMMPFKAFGVASLFVGSASCAVAGVVHASGIRQISRPSTQTFHRLDSGGRFEAAWSKHTIKARRPTQELQQWRTGDLTIIPPPGS
ncbi:uncharacterized protein LOC116265928 isoform X1 [Nymphaea colorata]|uniref:uncharacterized protein LOC116265928 isoform X1 n=1 Tax=Nymphaea colorata TaxID=210225 RepID=UPI00129EECA6|nr:uncharacterized protein LOC116265928 isoform X1 [Nymphaea colorata]